MKPIYVLYFIWSIITILIIIYSSMLGYNTIINIIYKRTDCNIINITEEHDQSFKLLSHQLGNNYFSTDIRINFRVCYNNNNISIICANCYNNINGRYGTFDVQQYLNSNNLYINSTHTCLHYKGDIYLSYSLYYYIPGDKWYWLYISLIGIIIIFIVITPILHGIIMVIINIKTCYKKRRKENKRECLPLIDESIEESIDSIIYDDDNNWIKEEKKENKENEEKQEEKEENKEKEEKQEEEQYKYKKIKEKEKEKKKENENITYIDGLLLWKNNNNNNNNNNNKNDKTIVQQSIITITSDSEDEEKIYNFKSIPITPLSSPSISPKKKELTTKITTITDNITTITKPKNKILELFKKTSPILIKKDIDKDKEKEDNKNKKEKKKEKNKEQKEYKKKEKEKEKEKQNKISPLIMEEIEDKELYINEEEEEEEEEEFNINCLTEIVDEIEVITKQLENNSDNSDIINNTNNSIIKLKNITEQFLNNTKILKDNN